MGIVTMVRLTCNMPKKMTDVNLYATPMYCYDSIAKNQGCESTVPSISNDEFMNRDSYKTHGSNGRETSGNGCET